MSSKWIVVALFALAGCTHQPATLVVDDAHAVFDSVAGVPFNERVLTFTNEGDETSAPLQVLLNGDVHAFQIAGDECGGVALKSNQHCRITVHLASDDPGAFEGELRVTSALVAADVLLSGKVMPAELALVPFSSSELDVVQGAMANLKFIVSNSGGATTGALSVVAHALPFDGVDDQCAGQTLAGGASCTITLTRTIASDATIGSSSGSLDVAAAPGGAQSTPVTLVVRKGSTLVVDDADWGTVPTVGNVQHTVSVLNPGPVASGPVTVIINATESKTPFSIAVDGCKGQELAAGKSCVVTVVANLIDINWHTATLDARANFVGPGSGTLRASGVRAHYSVLLMLTGTGTGKVRNASVDHADGETLLFSNTKPTGLLTALPDVGSTFSGWSGTTPCSGTKACTFTGADNSDLTLTATFTH